MTKDEMKNRISMALKDHILQQGFEIICKENAELKKQLEMSDRVYNDNLDYSYHIEEQLTKAKEIIKGLLNIKKIVTDDKDYEVLAKAEQFLKESE